MRTKLLFTIYLSIMIIITASCDGADLQQSLLPSGTAGQNPTRTITVQAPGETEPTPTPTRTATPAPTPTITATPFPFGQELTIEYLRDVQVPGSEIAIIEQLANGANYRQYLASYLSEGYTIYGLLTVPFEDPPQRGYKAVIFNHGYIPPSEYQTLERYQAYVDYLARSGFVVFKIDFRGHGQSEGYPSGSYFSPGYTIDAISALKSLQTLTFVDPEGIGMWGHSMAGNLILRAMLVEPAIQAGVIFAGAVYSYQDFFKYGISDISYQPPATPEQGPGTERLTSSRIIFEAYGYPADDHPYWDAISLAGNLSYLSSPIQIHHAENDPVVNIGYSYELTTQLQVHGKPYEFYIYEGGGHNIISPYFDQAMQRTVQFFQDNL